MAIQRRTQNEDFDSLVSGADKKNNLPAAQVEEKKDGDGDEDFDLEKIDENLKMQVA